MDVLVECRFADHVILKMKSFKHIIPYKYREMPYVKKYMELDKMTKYRIKKGPVTNTGPEDLLI